MSTLHWLCIGDFNEILCDENKQGGLEHPRHMMEDYRNAL